MQKKRVCILNTGGTIAMERTQDGYAPASGYLEQQMAAMPEFESDSMPLYHIHEYQPLLDSANITPQDWLKMARSVAEYYDQYDGFVVLHGTDTMAYTASALPFILQGLRKPVILTGSQIPLCEVRSDARENLITAMLIAANFAIPEVCLYFGDQLFRGCRAVKVNADGFDAFTSPNFPPLGQVGIDIEINWNRVLPMPDPLSQLEVKEIDRINLVALRLFPGISAEIFNHILQSPLQGLILEAYGVGNGPSNDQAFLTALQDAASRGLVIVDCTQCLAGTVDLGDYATGSALARAGVISGGDLTVEAALAKMFYLFSQNLPTETIKRLMQTNLRGELTPFVPY